MHNSSTVLNKLLLNASEVYIKMSLNSRKIWNSKCPKSVTSCNACRQASRLVHCNSVL